MGRSYLDGRCFCNRNFHTKKLIIFIRRIIFICPPLRKYCVAIYCLVISEFFEEEFLIPQEDSIDYHHPEESPVNSTINPQSKNNLNLSPISESVWIIANISDRPDYT